MSGKSVGEKWRKVDHFASCEFSITPRINHFLLLNAKRRKKFYLLPSGDSWQLIIFVVWPRKKMLWVKIVDYGEAIESCLWVIGETFAAPVEFFLLHKPEILQVIIKVLPLGWAVIFPL
jgi:hypothetical protein